MSEECAHFWVAAQDKNGNLDFRANRQMWTGLRVCVTCSECNARTRMTKEQWEALPSFDAPAGDRQ